MRLTEHGLGTRSLVPAADSSTRPTLVLPQSLIITHGVKPMVLTVIHFASKLVILLFLAAKTVQIRVVNLGALENYDRTFTNRIEYDGDP